jgi:hypothetical protein
MLIIFLLPLPPSPTGLLGLLLQVGGPQLSSGHVLGGVHFESWLWRCRPRCRKEEKKSNEIKALLSFLPFVASMGGMDLVRLLLKQKKSISKKTEINLKGKAN